MRKHYYLATNFFGGGRSLEPNNGWIIFAYNSKAERDKAYDDCDYLKTGCTKIFAKDIHKITGAKWHVEQSPDSEGGEIGFITV
jgi:hypothetical protein